MWHSSFEPTPTPNPLNPMVPHNISLSLKRHASEIKCQATHKTRLEWRVRVEGKRAREYYTVEGIWSYPGRQALHPPQAPFNAGKFIRSDRIYIHMYLRNWHCAAAIMYVCCPLKGDDRQCRTISFGDSGTRRTNNRNARNKLIWPGLRHFELFHNNLVYYYYAYFLADSLG